MLQRRRKKCAKHHKAAAAAAPPPVCHRKKEEEKDEATCTTTYSTNSSPFPYVRLHQDAKPLVELNITRRSEIGLSADCCTPAPAKEQKKRGRKRGRGKKGGRTRILNKLIERQFFYMLALKETKSKLVR